MQTEDMRSLYAGESVRNSMHRQNIQKKRDVKANFKGEFILFNI